MSTLFLILPLSIDPCSSFLLYPFHLSLFIPVFFSLNFFVSVSLAFSVSIFPLPLNLTFDLPLSFFVSVYACCLTVFLSFCFSVSLFALLYKYLVNTPFKLSACEHQIKIPFLFTYPGPAAPNSLLCISQFLWKNTN